MITSLKDIAFLLDLNNSKVFLSTLAMLSYDSTIMIVL